MTTALNPTTTGTYACASVSYFAKNLGEISIVIGDVIKILDEVDDFWLNGQTLHNGLEGRFPKDFVRLVALPDVNDYSEKLLFALDTFCTDEQDDLNFKRGDVLVLERSIDESWGWGRCNGRSGMFPFNYTKELQQIQHHNGVTTTATKPTTVNHNSSSSVNVTSYVKVLYPFTSQLAGELNLQQGEVVAVTSRLADGWACGYVGDRSGEFPLAFTQELLVGGNQTNDGGSDKAVAPPSSTVNGNYSVTTEEKGSLKDLQSRKSGEVLVEEECSQHNDSHALQHNGLNGLTPTKDIGDSQDAAGVSLFATTTSGSSSGGTAITSLITHPPTTVFTLQETAGVVRTTTNELSAREIEEFEGSVDITTTATMMYNPKVRGASSGYIQRTNAVDHMLQSANSYEDNSTPPPPALIEVSEKWYVVLHDVIAVTDFDLTVRTHERIQIVKKINSTWCEARNSVGRTGFVPLDCIVSTTAKSQGLCRQTSVPSTAAPKVLVRSSTDTDLNKAFPPPKNFNRRGASDTAGRRRRRKATAAVTGSSKSAISSSSASTTSSELSSNPPPLSISSSGDLPPKFPERSTSLRLPQRSKKRRDVLLLPDDVTVSSSDSKEVVTSSSTTDGGSRHHRGGGGVIKRTNSIPPKRPPQPTFGRRSLRRQSSSRHSHKKKIEKVRVRIEEVTREEKNLAKLIDRATEGKEQQDLVQRRQFANIKLRRLQKELQNLIDGADDVYECIDDYLVMNDIPESTSSSTSVVGASPVVSSSEQHHVYVTDPTEPKQNSRRVKRNQVVNELIVTEKAFLFDIRVIVEDMLHPMMQKEFSGDVPVDKIFGNIEEVYGFTQLLSTELDELLDDETATEYTIREDDNFNVGTVFLRHVEQMEAIYKSYCRNYDDSIVIMEKLKEEGPEFDTVVNELLENIRRKKTSVFTLDSFLIKPIQRVLKYPLLFDQILKNSHMEDGQLCYDIARAAKKIEDVANAINEDRRRKELVRHYKTQNMDVKISEKLRKLNFGSVKKKSSRISQYIRNATGFAQVDTEDSRFNQVEARFKRIEKVVKMFQTNMDDLLCRQRDFLQAQAHVASSLLAFHMTDTNDSIKSYAASMCRVSEQSFRQFHDKVQLQAISPLSTLIERYRAPHALIDKRFDKLLDYESSLRHPHTNQVQMAQNVYEALNNQLCDELPKLCDLSITLLGRCVDIFNKLHAQFLRNITKELEPFYKTFQNHPLSYDKHSTDTYKIMQAYREQSSMIETEMAKFSFMPKTFQIESPMSQRRKTSTYQQSVQQQNRQTIQMKEQLMSKYSVSNSYVAHRNYSSANMTQISCVPGDIIGVIKKQDPNGNTQNWFADNGFRQGFLPSDVLREFDPVYDFQTPSHQHSPSFCRSLRRDSFGNNPTSTSSQPSSPMSSPARTRANVGTYGQVGQSNTPTHGQSNVGTYGQVGQSNTPTHGQSNVGTYGQVGQSNTPTHGQSNVGTYGQVGQSSTPTHGQVGQSSTPTHGQVGQPNTPTHGQANVGTYGQVGQSNTPTHGQVGQSNTPTHGQVGQSNTPTHGQANVGTYGQVGQSSSVASPVQTTSSVPGSPITRTTEAAQQQQHYRVEFSFIGRTNLELTVKEGEIVILLHDRDKEGNTDWMLVGNSAGKRGYVPSNYIAPVDYL